MDLKEAAIYNIANIFKGTGNKKSSQNGCLLDGKPSIVNIPVYQRPYRWADPNDENSPKCIDKLFEDYLENKETDYFIGSTVFVDRTKISEPNYKTFDVIDGQQRLTTLYLINYVRFLILREILLLQLSKTTASFIGNALDPFIDCFSSLLCTNVNYFDDLKESFNKILVRLDDDPTFEEEAKTEMSQLVRKKLFAGIDKIDDKDIDAINKKIDSIKNLLDKNELSLRYSRAIYNDVLKKALCSVCLFPKDRMTYYYELVISKQDDDVNKYPYLRNYTFALQQIFDQLSDQFKNSPEENEKVQKSKNPDVAYLKCLGDFASKMLENLSLCVVISSNDNDANKLFEVLNDRALDVSDLELMKNRFYMQYCKSGDSDSTIDDNIIKSEEIWSDTFKPDAAKAKNKLISFLGTVYLTGNSSLTYSTAAKFVNEISVTYFKNGDKKYSAIELKEDFNVYRAVKIILDRAGMLYQNAKLIAKALEVENEDSSYVKKTLWLLLAREYHSVLPALINPIISYYQFLNRNDNNKSLAGDGFENSFSSYIESLFKSNYTDIQKIAKRFWTATIRADGSNLVKKLADLYTNKNCKGKYQDSEYKCGAIDSDSFDDYQDQLDRQFSSWLNEWTYKDKDKFLQLKILFFRLMLLNRQNKTDSYKSDRVEFLSSDIVSKYIKEASKLELDHLEANNPKEGIKTYFKIDDLEERNKYVSGLGNFMILDKDKNIEKNNEPISVAVSDNGFYQGVKDSWLVQDIKNMLVDPQYAKIDKKDFLKNIPNEEFFNERTRRLKIYFKALIKNISDSDDGAFEVDLKKATSSSGS